MLVPSLYPLSNLVCSFCLAREPPREQSDDPGAASSRCEGENGENTNVGILSTEEVLAQGLAKWLQ